MKTRIILPLLITGVVLYGVGCVTSTQRTVRAGQHRQLFQMETSNTTVHAGYLLYVPEEYLASTNEWPLMLFLHGAGERGGDLATVEINGLPQLIAKDKAEFPFIIVSPQCPSDDWWSSDRQTETLNALLDEIVARYRVDKQRLYLTGLSMGGSGTWHLGMAYPDRFAAIAPICGGGKPEWASKIKNVPVWAFHGARDDTVPEKCSAEMVDALQQCGGNVKYTVYPDLGHNSWDRAYNNHELYTWFLSHRRLGDGTILVQEPAPLGDRLKDYLAVKTIQELLVFSEVSGDPTKEIVFSLNVLNPLAVDLDVRVEWEQNEETIWTVKSDPGEERIPPGQTRLFRHTARPDKKGSFFPLPSCNVNFVGVVQTNPRNLKLPIYVKGYLREHRPTMVAKHSAAAPTIDGILNEAVWQDADVAVNFTDMGLTRPASVRTEGSLAYDDSALYVAMRCHEPFMDLLDTDVTNRDGSVWEDDSVEILIDTDRDEKTYYHIAVNAACVVFDAMGYDNSLNANIAAAAGREKGAWTVELAIPWAELKMEAPTKGAKMACLLARTRRPKRDKNTNEVKAANQVLQYPPSPAGNHHPELFGNLELAGEP